MFNNHFNQKLRALFLSLKPTETKWMSETEHLALKELAGNSGVEMLWQVYFQASWEYVKGASNLASKGLG